MKISNETRQKSYLVTGSSSGIGLCICNNFLENRSKVLGISRRRGEIFNDNFKHISADLSNPISVSDIQNPFENLDGIVCAAGIMSGASLSDLDLNDLETMWNIHVYSHINIIKKFMPSLNDGGRIILIGSRVSTGAANKSAYSTTKSALFGFCRSLAAELIDRQITVNIVSPAATETPMLSDPNRSSIQPQKPPMGRYISPAEVADTVLFLTTESARSITGQNIVICAGSSL
jgi:3-oxoacyl-[acyl-carrier protein] reductase